MNWYRSIPRRYTIALRFRSDFWEYRIISADIFKISVDPSKQPSSSFFSFFFPLLQSSMRGSDEHGQLLRHGYGGHLLLHVLRFSSSLLISFPTVVLAASSPQPSQKPSLPSSSQSLATDWSLNRKRAEEEPNTTRLHNRRRSLYGWVVGLSKSGLPPLCFWRNLPPPGSNANMKSSSQKGE